MQIEPFGHIEYNPDDKEWFGMVSHINPDHEIELAIESDDGVVLSVFQIERIKTFAVNYADIVDRLYELTYQKYFQTPFKKTREEIEQMYFLSSVSFKKDSRTFWIVMEPHFSVASVYNHFLRFTMIDNKITWTNF